MEKEKKVWTVDGWLKQPSHPSKECLVNIYQPPGFKTW